MRTSPDYFKSVLHDLHVSYTSFLLRTVREAVDEGELPPDTDAEMVRSMVYGGIEHRMWSLLFGRGTIDVEATADRYTAMLLHGVLAPAPAGTEPASVAQEALSRGDIERRLARLERIVAAAPLPSTPPSLTPSITPAPRSDAAAAQGRSMTLIRKLFIANRAEIALRIVRTAQRLGIDTVVPWHRQDRAGPALAAATETVESSAIRRSRPGWTRRTSSAPLARAVAMRSIRDTGSCPRTRPLRRPWRTRVLSSSAPRRR